MAEKITSKTFTTKACIGCGEITTLVLDGIDQIALQDWAAGMFVQQAFCHWTKDQRELLISGTHSECWDAMFGDEEE